jgi:pimeloyl-ACP methyl ester carboxylesterase
MRTLLLAVVVVLATVMAADLFAPHTVAPLLLRLQRARAGLTTEHVTVDGVDVTYTTGGTGEPLILIHGFGADKDHFTRLAGWLTPHVRVFVPDLLGFGDSPRPTDASYAPADQAERVRAFARALGLARVHLGGNSMGGFIVTDYALAHPDEVASLWLLAPAGTALAFDSDLTRAMAASGSNPLLVRTTDDFARTMDFVMVRRPFAPSSVVRVLAERASADYPLHARIFEVVGPGHVATIDARLKELTMPTLVVWGSADRALNPAAACVYTTAMPRAQVVRLDGVGHLPMLEAPRETAEAYLEFRGLGS